MELRRCSNGITNSRTHPAVGGDIAIVPTRSVHGRYLLDTEEYGEDGGVAHEGEVKVAVVCENLTHSSLWIVFPMCPVHTELSLHLTVPGSPGRYLDRLSHLGLDSKPE